MSISSLLNYLHQYSDSIPAVYAVNLSLLGSSVLSKPKSVIRDPGTFHCPICRLIEGLTSFLNTFGAPGKYQIIREAFSICFDFVILLSILNL